MIDVRKSMTIYPDSLVELLDRLVREVNRTHMPVHFSFPSGSAVLVSEADWKGMRETLRRLTESSKGVAHAPDSVE